MFTNTAVGGGIDALAFGSLLIAATALLLHILLFRDAPIIGIG